MAEPGTLYLVATPIGNLEDITARAARILAEVDFIACEDTRTSGVLLKHLDIRKPLVPYHDFNEGKAADRIIDRVIAGENGAVICDAGSPGISDPGFVVARTAVGRGVNLVPIPGPAAMIAALAVSGLPTDAFTFHGFLPPKSGKRRTILESLADRRETLILYESPHKIKRLLGEVKEVLGNRQIALCRELTKKFEEVMRGTVHQVIEQIGERQPKGEITLVIEGKTRKSRQGSE
ncbi:MAG: 16S rRNA (cytidine(1402)-2'-O)-methyltransferase [bacterium]